MRSRQRAGVGALHRRRPRVATSYPANPNGSPFGIAAITNEDGRVTLTMPHPERSFRYAQNSWRPDGAGEYWRLVSHVRQRAAMGGLSKPGFVVAYGSAVTSAPLPSRARARGFCSCTKNSPHLHRVLQPALAHVRLVEEILHHFEQHRGLIGVDDRQVDERLGGAREDDAHHHRESVLVDLRHLAHVGQRIEQPQLGGIAEIARTSPPRCAGTSTRRPGTGCASSRSALRGRRSRHPPARS